MRRLLQSLLLPLILSGCAGSPGWTNAGLPRDRWAPDFAECRNEAEEILGPGAFVEPGTERASNPMQMVDQAQNAKRYDAMVGSCMMEKGYRRAQ